jgi:transcriptional regulator GlxA family with amidase domain
MSHKRVLSNVVSLLLLAGSALAQNQAQTTTERSKLKVAFVVSEQFNIIDFAGPWEVFNDAKLPVEGKKRESWPSLFENYTVSDSTAPIKTGGNQATLIPSYTFGNAPNPDIIVVGAQDSNTPVFFEWLRKHNSTGTTVMSVCIGAVKLARAGLLDGKSATTHHAFLDAYRDGFPKTNWINNRRFVRSTDTIYTAGGLTSGIDLALHLVAKRFGDAAAQATADWMEYEGQGWKQKE